MPPILGRILLRHFGPGIRCISLPAQYSTPVDNATQQLPIFERKTLQWTQGRELVLRLTVEHKRGQLIIDILDRPAMARNNSRQHSQQAMQHNQGQQQVKENGHRIWMPIPQTRLLVAQMRKLAYDYKFRLWKTKGTGLDRLLENDLGNGLLRTVYTHRVPGQLYGDTQQSALYFSLMKFKIDSAKQRSDMITKQTQAFDADPIEEQQLMELATSGQPLVFISQHILVPNPYHAWQPNIFSILFPASLLNQFVDIVGRMLANPIVGVWDQRDNKDNNDPTTSSNSELQFGPKYFFSTARWQLNARSQRKFQRYTRMPEWFEKRAVPTISSSWAQEQWQPETEQKQQEMQKQHQQLQINERRMVAQQR